MSNIPQELYYTSLFTDNSLKAYWRLEDNSLDETVNNHDGTDTDITYSTGNGKFNKGAGCNGTSSKIVIPNHEDFRPTGNFSVNLWFKGSDKTNFQQLFTSCDTDSSAGTPYGGFRCGILDGTGCLYFDIFNGSTSAEVTHVDGSIDVCDNAFHQLSYLWDGSVYRLYVDGSADGTSTSSTAPGYLATNFVTISGWVTTQLSERYWAKGAIDDVAFFNRALTAIEISNLYNGLLTVQSTNYLKKYRRLSFQ